MLIVIVFFANTAFATGYFNLLKKYNNIIYKVILLFLFIFLNSLKKKIYILFLKTSVASMYFYCFR